TLGGGRLPLLPGDAATFVPVVTVDHLARFLTEVPERDTGGVRAHWVLDETTPNLPELVDHLATHLGVRAPRRFMPVGVLRRLPRAVTRAEPETLPFLTADRYDTASAHALARAAGLTHPPVRDALARWADRLVADGFGALPPGRPGGLHPVAGSRTYLAGERSAPDHVLLHGLPLDGESWHAVADRLDGSALVPDLPGLGRSAPARVPVDVWLAELLAPVVGRPVLVGHSAGCAPALRHAHAHPDRVGALVLVAPAFLQPDASPALRLKPLVRAVLSRMTAERLAAFTGLGEDTADDRAVVSAALNLRRPGAAARAAEWLAAARRPAERAALRALLATCPVPVTLVVGEHDPVGTSGLDVRVVTVPGAGHYPQLVAPDMVAERIARAAAAAGAAV
ncbi:alpha/beta fold hydrolase, partial [Thermobifida halotolerans]|uniref:alpha/beta fold hydrolase n=1 Tax=Thermobifida halotolerans TaxID=483545 RepID=UPI0018FEAD65